MRRTWRLPSSTTTRTVRLALAGRWTAWAAAYARDREARPWPFCPPLGVLRPLR